MTRIVLLAAALLAALAAPAAAADRWTPVRGEIRGAVVDAAVDGPRVLVLGVGDRGLIVTTLRDDRVTRRQVLAPSIRYRIRPRILPLGRGAAIVVWEAGNRILASHRPSARARFGTPRLVSRHPGAAGITARHLTATAAPGGRAVAAWWGGPADGRLGIWAADAGRDGAWSAPREISAGTYPAIASSSPPLVAIGAASSPDGGVAIAWRQPEPGRPTVSWGARIAGVTRTPAGQWSAPVTLGVADATLLDLPVATGAAGTIAAGWADARTLDPNGVVATTCAVVAVTAGGAPGVASDLACSPQYRPGGLRLAASSDGGLLAARQVVPNQGLADEPLRASIELFRRGQDGAWTPTGLAVVQTRFWQLDAFTPVAGGGALLLASIPAPGGATIPQVRAVVVRDDGTVARRIRAPRGVRPGGIRLFALAPGPRSALMLGSRVDRPHREGAWILSLGG